MWMGPGCKIAYVSSLSFLVLVRYRNPTPQNQDSWFQNDKMVDAVRRLRALGFATAVLTNNYKFDRFVASGSFENNDIFYILEPAKSSERRSSGTSSTRSWRAPLRES